LAHLRLPIMRQAQEFDQALTPPRDTEVKASLYLGVFPGMFDLDRTA
jgi:hypothetical protein